ncbi:unnamed protein product [Protopolystoma xenopodis]|uniref:Uncharacterized protein n=1 Tax=Protopolystoma xenopodis TaxID=117903 RepID=A0A448WLW5_9PLAT|nr:unnamed protein product [Protopolystoma xenopodis]
MFPRPITSIHGRSHIATVATGAGAAAPTCVSTTFSCDQPICPSGLEGGIGVATAGSRPTLPANSATAATNQQLSMRTVPPASAAGLSVHNSALSNLTVTASHSSEPHSRPAPTTQKSSLGCPSPRQQNFSEASSAASD